MAQSKEVVKKLLIKDLEYDIELLSPQIDTELGLNEQFYIDYHEISFATRDPFTILTYSIYHLDIELFRAILKTANKVNGCNVNLVSGGGGSHMQLSPVLHCLRHAALGKLSDIESANKLIEMLYKLIDYGAFLDKISFNESLGESACLKPLTHLFMLYPKFRNLMRSDDVTQIPSYFTPLEQIIFSALLPKEVKNGLEYMNNLFPHSVNSLVMDYYRFDNNEYWNKFLDSYPKLIRIPALFNNLFKLSFLCYKEERDGFETFFSGLDSRSNSKTNEASEIQKLKTTVTAQAAKIKQLEDQISMLNKSKMASTEVVARTDVARNEKTEDAVRNINADIFDYSDSRYDFDHSKINKPSKGLDPHAKFDYFFISNPNPRRFDQSSVMALREQSKKTSVNDKKQKI